MLGGIRPIASLSSGLLARKGQARPAMRPQGFGGFGASSAPIDDLGWNDMGAPEALPEPPLADPASLPPVLVERSALQDEVARIPMPAAPAVEPNAVGTAPAEPIDFAGIERAAARPGKAAFTLRLPSDRHLRLRLAAAVTHRSAQAIVTEALDAFLSTLPEVEELATRCSAPDRLGNPS